MSQIYPQSIVKYLQVSPTGKSIFLSSIKEYFEKSLRVHNYKVKMPW